LPLKLVNFSSLMNVVEIITELLVVELDVGEVEILKLINCWFILCLVLIEVNSGVELPVIDTGEVEVDLVVD